MRPLRRPSRPRLRRRPAAHRAALLPELRIPHIHSRLPTVDTVGSPPTFGVIASRDGHRIGRVSHRHPASRLAAFECRDLRLVAEDELDFVDPL